MTFKRIAILGGGYAAMAAAVELSQAGCRVTVFEATNVLGGRSRAVQLDGCLLDNGQHLVIGAYTELLRLMHLCGVEPDTVFLRYPLELQIEPDFRLAFPRLPAPWHLLAGFLSVRGLCLKERIALIRWLWTVQTQSWTLSQDCTVTQWLNQTKQPARLIEYLWKPLTLATLNTPIHKASAQVLLNVLHDSLGHLQQTSDFLLPTVDLSTLFPNPAARFVSERGGKICLGTRVRSLTQLQGDWQVNDFDDRYDAILCALPLRQLGQVLSGFSSLAPLIRETQSWSFQPISTIYLQYPPSVRLPRPMMGLSHCLAQWVFDRGWTHQTAGLLAVVISAEGRHQQLQRATLLARIQAELHAHFNLPEQANWCRIISEKQATFACVPGLSRPANRTPEPRLWLAGDYTASPEGKDYPSTLESAVRSGVAAAHGLLAELLGC